MAWLWDNIVGVITTVLAIYGAVLSSLNYWHMRKRYKKELYIEASFHQSSNSAWSYVQVYIANKSLRPITIKEYGFKYASSSDSKLLEPGDLKINLFGTPIKLATSEQFSYRIDFNLTKSKSNFMLKAIPYAIDTEGQRYTGVAFNHPDNFVFIRPNYIRLT